MGQVIDFPRRSRWQQAFANSLLAYRTHFGKSRPADYPAEWSNYLWFSTVMRLLPADWQEHLLMEAVDLRLLPEDDALPLFMQMEQAGGGA